MLDYIRIACAVPPVRVGDVTKNVEDICARIEEADGQGVDLVVFPELALTGYTCADLFFQDTLLDACKKAGFQPDISIRSNDMKYYEKLVDSGIGIGVERNNPGSMRQRNIAYLDVSDFVEDSVVFAYYKKEAAYGNIEQFLQFLSSKDFM